MACSKLFSGDLPEISTYIIQNLRKDFNTLYSLALANRFWCRLAIPLLWEDPFSIRYRENLSSHFLDTYLLFLNENDKSKLIEEIGSYDFDHKPPLFNYPSLIKTLDLSRVRLHVEKWLITPISATSTNLVQRSSNKKHCLPTCLQNEPIETIDCKDYKKSRAIFIHLFNLFIENNASLNSFYTNFLTKTYFNDICKYCDINNSKFISGIEILSINYYDYCTIYIPSNLKPIKTFLSSLASLSNSIKHINISSDRPEFNELLANIIQSQSQLSSVKLSLPKVLDSLKHSSNTLTSITFKSCHFSNSMRFDALSYLTQLESLQFKNCIGLNLKVIQPLLNITTPLKIKTFVIIDNGISYSEFTPISLLIQKIGSYIENLVLSIREDELRGKLFDTIIDFCKEIKFLCLDCIDFMNISQLPKIISNLNLKYLTLKIKFQYYDFFHTNDNEYDLKISSMILNELSQLSLSLDYLDLSLVINPDDLQTAFENCKHVELKKLLIKNWSRNNVDTTLKVIKDYVKEKNLEFLAYYIVNNSLFADEECLKSLEKLAEEIQSFIKMVRYDDLAVKVSEINENLINN